MMKEPRDIKLHVSWKQLLLDEFSKPYMQELREFLALRKKSGAAIYPPGSQIFAAMDQTPFENVRVVILGQDPYHGPGQAHGLSFSVPPGVAVPPSLRNIFKELNDDLGIRPAGHGNLTAWANQGVLLLNSVLTVEAGQAGAHQSKGWERFTDQIIRLLNDKNHHLVFMLWGGYAQKKGSVLDRSRHCVLTAPHPSPLSAHRGFLGCGHFSLANAYLAEHGHKPIDWSLTS